MPDPFPIITTQRKVLGDRESLQKYMFSQLEKTNTRLERIYEVLEQVEDVILMKLLEQIESGDFDVFRAVAAHNKIIDSVTKMERMKFEAYDRLSGSVLESDESTGKQVTNQDLSKFSETLLAIMNSTKTTNFKDN